MGAIETTDASIDDIAFLARSGHRVDVLSELATGERTRTELHETTGIIQPTLGRILNDFEDRAWVRNGGSTYALTPFGALLAEGFDELVSVVDTMRAFREVSRWLPLEEMDFDLRRLRRATITTPSAADGSAHLRREEELVARAGSLRHLCSSAFPPHIETYRDRIVEDGQRFEAVITGDALDAAAAHPDAAVWVREIAAVDNATIYRYEGPVPYQLGIVDDTALIVPLDDAGTPCALIETDDDVIREWVLAELEAYRSQSTRLS